MNFAFRCRPLTHPRRVLVVGFICAACASRSSPDNSATGTGAASPADTTVDVIFTLAPGTADVDRKAFAKGVPSHLTVTRVDGNRVFARATMVAVRIQSRIRYVTSIDLAGR